MLDRGNPYVYAAVAIVLVFVIAAVDSTGAKVVLAAVTVAAATGSVLVLMRQRRDPKRSLRAALTAATAGPQRRRAV
ncbi:hypothetical protein [Pseudokineococcus sp. 1T1Z-3]|uniref:hypothetical protein n=1 Tax=Pseudokineococcus sp. 1T1Z-3 TaxID=3132745 RepID=UPI00309B708E